MRIKSKTTLQTEKKRRDEYLTPPGLRWDTPAELPSQLIISMGMLLEPQSSFVICPIVNIQVFFDREPI